jgi:hypothetical protein
VIPAGNQPYPIHAGSLPRRLPLRVSALCTIGSPHKAVTAIVA